jgi:hypothetical protein
MRREHALELAWALWLIATVGAFVAFETLGYRNRRLPSLSRTLERWMGVEPRNRWGAVSPFVFTAGGAWITWHIARGKFDPS